LEEKKLKAERQKAHENKVLADKQEKKAPYMERDKECSQNPNPNSNPNSDGRIAYLPKRSCKRRET